MVLILSLAHPGRFSRLAKILRPWIAGFAGGFLLLGLWFALFASPPDFRQGEVVRLMYIHVPAAQAGLGIYAVMTLSALSFLIWRHPLAEIIVRESAAIGTAFTFLCLFTGALWGKPSWGTWWVWDARLTSMLILFFTYIGYILLAQSAGNRVRSSAGSFFFLIAGAVNLPIIKFSVEWWNTLHQPASLLRWGGPRIDPSMLVPLLLMMAGVFFFYLWFLLASVSARLNEARYIRETM